MFRHCSILSANALFETKQQFGLNHDGRMGASAGQIDAERQFMLSLPLKHQGMVLNKD